MGYKLVLHAKRNFKAVTVTRELDVINQLSVVHIIIGSIILLLLKPETSLEQTYCTTNICTVCGTDKQQVQNNYYFA